MENRITTQEVIALTGCRQGTVQMWARKNNLEAIIGPTGGVVCYLWSDDDVARFMSRPKPGRPVGPVPKKPESE
jgi:hypothetical protein